MTLETILKEKEYNLGRLIEVILRMSVPAILAELTSIAMQYIDAAMVGSLGANATGAIGLVSSSTWLMGGACIGLSAGFYVQTAQLVGGERLDEAAHVFRQGLKVMLVVGIAACAVGTAISGPLPVWLGGEPEVLSNASMYFRIYSCSLPFALIRQLSAGMMQASGNMRTPSQLSALVCLLDVIFNMFFIFPTRTIQFLGLSLLIPGAGLGVTGAALGTALAEVVVMFLMLRAAWNNEKIGRKRRVSWKLQKTTLQRALKVAVPLTLDHVFMCSAYVMGTVIVSPLGTTALAANSLAVTAESLCYMPGYGIGSAASTLVGQSIGAGRADLTKKFSRLTVYLGMLLMGASAIVMYALAPFALSILTSDAQVAELGARVLRMELIAEPLYGASICCAGVFRGAGDTLVSSILNLASMWGVRIVLAAILVPQLGLSGYWIAMTIELCFRGSIFLIRLFRNKWMKKSLV